MISSKA
ncbi:hypothetical protein CP082626L3_0174A, partial [Chlamydia psittaci 08-2626_L3]